MEKQQFINTMIKEWGSDFDYLTLTFEDGDTATFGRSYIWVGGSEDEEKWGCDLLGNVEYDDFEYYVEEVANWVYDELSLKIIEINC